MNCLNQHRPDTSVNKKNDKSMCDKLNTIYMNARSVKSVRSNINKITEMHNLIAIYQPHLLAVTETWLNSSISSTELFPHNYAVHRRDREEIEPGRVGGGAMLAVSDFIHSERKCEFEPHDQEILVCESKPADSKAFIFIVAYNPHSATAESFFIKLNEVLVNISKKYDLIFVSGDFNCPQIKWNDIYSRIPDYVSDFMLGNSLIQCNGVPSNVCGNILDLLFVNDESKVDQVAAMDVDFTTDHTVLNFNILLKMSEKPSVSRKVFNYKKTYVEKLCALLSKLPYFNTATDVTDIDAA